MLPPHLRKFRDLYEKYGLGAVKNFWLLTCLLPLARTVNLYKLKDYVGGVLENDQTDPMSHYRRLTRFFEDWGGREDFLHDLMRQLLRFLKGMGFKTLVLDGTSWRVGEAEIHYLVLGVLVNKVAVPIYWVQLGKIGASSQEERRAMFEKALQVFDLKGMTLLADREYVGKSWFKFLKTNNINFVIRLKHGDYESEVDAQKGKPYWQMFFRCAAKNKVLKRQIWLDGEFFTFVMMPNPKVHADEPVLLFLTTLTDAKKAAELYVFRWKIECLFKHLKSNGFHLEDLNLKDEGKNLLMFAVAATAYTLTIRKAWKYRNNIATKTFADGSETLEKSIFREGLARITAICFTFIRFLTFVFNAQNCKNHPLFKNVQ